MKTEVFTYQYNYGDKFKPGQIIGDRKRHLIKSIYYDAKYIRVTAYKLSKRWWKRPLQVIYLRYLVL